MINYIAGFLVAASLQGDINQENIRPTLEYRAKELRQQPLEEEKPARQNNIYSSLDAILPITNEHREIIKFRRYKHH